MGNFLKLKQCESNHHKEFSNSKPKLFTNEPTKHTSVFFTSYYLSPALKYPIRSGADTARSFCFKLMVVQSQKSKLHGTTIILINPLSAYF